MTRARDWLVNFFERNASLVSKEGRGGCFEWWEIRTEKHDKSAGFAQLFFLVAPATQLLHQTFWVRHAGWRINVIPIDNKQMTSSKACVHLTWCHERSLDNKSWSNGETRGGKINRYTNEERRSFSSCLRHHSFFVTLPHSNLDRRLSPRKRSWFSLIELSVRSAVAVNSSSSLGNRGVWSSMSMSRIRAGPHQIPSEMLLSSPVYHITAPPLRWNLRIWKNVSKTHVFWFCYEMLSKWSNNASNRIILPDHVSPKWSLNYETVFLFCWIRSFKFDWLRSWAFKKELKPALKVWRTAAWEKNTWMNFAIHQDRFTWAYIHKPLLPMVYSGLHDTRVIDRTRPLLILPTISVYLLALKISREDSGKWHLKPNL